MIRYKDYYFILTNTHIIKSGKYKDKQFFACWDFADYNDINMYKAKFIFEFRFDDAKVGSKDFSFIYLEPVKIKIPEHFKEESDNENIAEVNI